MSTIAQAQTTPENPVMAGRFVSKVTNIHNQAATIPEAPAKTPQTKYVRRTLPGKKEIEGAQDIRSGLLSSGDWAHRQTISPHNCPNPPKGAGWARITKILEPNTTSFMTSGHDSATALFKEVRGEVKLDTFDKLTREMKRLKDLAYKFHMTHMIVYIDVATAMARRAYVLFRYQRPGTQTRQTSSSLNWSIS